MSWLNKLFKPKQKPTNVMIAVADFQTITPDSMKHVFSSDMSIFKIMSCFPTILEYAKAMDSVIKALDEDQLIASYEVAKQPQVIYLIDFLTDNERRYVSDEEITIFINTAILFLLKFNEIENNNNKSINQERVLYLSGFIYNNLILLAKELKSVSR